jgi:hypothetical protein
VKVLAVQVQMCSTMYHEALTKLIDVLQMDFFKRGFGIQILEGPIDHISQLPFALLVPG